jgi:flagellar motor switch protein FliM
MPLQKRLHETMTAVATERRQAFSVELIRRKTSKVVHQMNLLAPLADSLADHAGTAFSELVGLPVRITIVSTKIEDISSLARAEPGFDIVSAENTLSCWCEFDRQFDHLLCELCLGASGWQRKEDDVERPSTLFEKKLRNLAHERLVEAVGKALQDVGELVGLVVQSRSRASARRSQAPLQCYCLRLLFNASDDACEFDVFLSVADCMTFLSGDVTSVVDPARSANEVVETAKFPVEVFLKSDVVDVRQILNLVPGEILKLNVGAATPVELRLSGRTLSRGLVSFGEKHVGIKLLDSKHLPLVQEEASLNEDVASSNG